MKHIRFLGELELAQALGPDDTVFLGFLRNKLPSHHVRLVSKVLMHHKPDN